MILVPEHILPLGIAAMLTLAAIPAFTTIVILFDVAGEPVAHVKLDVITQVMMSPLASVFDM